MSLLRGRPLIVGLVLFILAVVVAVAAPRYATGLVRVVIDATPVASFDNRDPSKVRFGNLEFRGGLTLESKYPAFGGISGIHVEPGGNRFIAVTDKGSWLRGRIIYRDGRPAGIADTEMAPILGQDGRPLATRGWYDTESLAERDGILYVGIERVEQIVRFDYRRDGLLARGQPINVPADFKTLTYNKSLECVAAPPQGPLAGELIAVSEKSLDAAGNLRSFVLGTNRVHVSASSGPRSSTSAIAQFFRLTICCCLSGAFPLCAASRYAFVACLSLVSKRVRSSTAAQ